MAKQQDTMSKAEAQAAAKAAMAEAKQAGQHVRLDAWRSVFEKTNRILSGKALQVRIVGKDEVDGMGLGKVPGWSDGETINFNGPIVLDMLNQNDALAAVLRLKGLNYHELSHVLYTPRQSEELPKKVIERANADGDPSWWWAMNALEDQRIETWFTAAYGPSRRYFEATVLQWLLKDGNAEAATLLHGRKYLTPSLRVKAEKVFVEKYSADLMQRFQSVIDEYLTVVLPKDTLRAFTLISKYRDLCKEMQSQSGAPLPKLVIEDNGVHDGTPGKHTQTVARSGRVTGKDAQDAASRAKQVVAKSKIDDAKARKDLADQQQQGQDGGQDGQDTKGGGGSGQQPSGAPGSTPAQGGGQQGGGSGGDGGGDSSQQGGQQQGGGVGGGGAGTDTGTHEVLPGGSGDPLKDAIKDMIGEAQDNLDDVAADAELQDDVSRVLSAVKATINNGKQDAAGEIAHKGGTVNPSQETLVAQRRVRQVIQRIRTEVEPQILRRQDAGRIDVRRVLSRRPNENDIFTSYDEGMEDETGMEAVILCDISGSMGGVMTEASTALWTLKRAFDALDIRCTVLAFDTNHFIVYQPGQRAKSKVSIISSMGGTDPTSALKQAQIIFSKSHAPSKVLVTITDGQWGGDPRVWRGLMRAMHQVGTTSMLLGLNGAQRAYGKHDHMIGHDLTSISELPRAVTKVVAQIMRTKTAQGV